uniref:Secreted protein n=1 Tax=Schistosoma mansoni TaxID=6183 RepID=A0A5K4F4T6_SCHMA
MCTSKTLIYLLLYSTNFAYSNVNVYKPLKTLTHYSDLLFYLASRTYTNSSLHVLVVIHTIVLPYILIS